MKTTLIFLCLCLFLCNSCVKKESKIDPPSTEDSEIENSDTDAVVSKLSGQVNGIEDDTSLNIETAGWTLGDATFTCSKHFKQDKLVKMYWRSTSAYGEELFKIYYGNDGSLIFISSRSRRSLCDDEMNMCSTSNSNYYDHSELLVSQQRKATHRPGEIPDYDSIPIRPDPETDEEIKNKDQRILDMISKEVQTVEFFPSQRFVGEYMYFADAAVFKDCASEKTYPIHSYDLEVAYLKFGQLQTYIGLILVGNIEIQPNMEGNPVETIILKEIVKFSPMLSCN